jgi:hypothetical protein
MMIDIDELIETSLSAARSSIIEHGTCVFLVIIVHPGGIKSLIFQAAPSNPSEESGLENQINYWAGLLNSDLVIVISDKWIGEDTSDGCVAISATTPFAGRRKALAVEILGSLGVVKAGMQKYWGRAGGEVHFGEFLWGEPLV